LVRFLFMLNPAKLDWFGYVAIPLPRSRNYFFFPSKLPVPVGRSRSRFGWLFVDGVCVFMLLVKGFSDGAARRKDWLIVRERGGKRNYCLCRSGYGLNRRLLHRLRGRLLRPTLVF
jgi:hypothetical protein